MACPRKHVRSLRDSVAAQHAVHRHSLSELLLFLMLARLLVALSFSVLTPRNLAL